jgi:cytochrome c-type biogenesis protein
VAATMLVFGLGAAFPLLAFGLVSRETMMRWRGRLMTAGRGLKIAMGAGLVAVGALILSGLDKRIEAALVEASPDWLTTLTTRF